MITVSAPGKIHLLGEHAVVYGKPALLTTINLRVYLTIKEKNGEYKKSPKIKDQQIIKAQNTLESIIKKRFDKKIPPYRLTIKSQLPIGSGLGSSAAFSAAFSAALLSFLKIKWDLSLVNKLAYEGEKIFHGNPSGGDNSAVVFGGLIWFKKETDDLKIIRPLPFSISKNFKQFILINSGKPLETTKEMVNLVKLKVKNLFNNQGELTKKLVQALRVGDEDLLIKIIREGERNLEKLGVVSKGAKEIIRQVEDLGGGAKISGAGGIKAGSGMLLSYHQNPKKVLDFAKKNNLEALKIKIGEEGLRSEG